MRLVVVVGRPRVLDRPDAIRRHQDRVAGILVPRVVDREREAMPSQTIDGGISHLAARPDAVQRAADEQDWAVDALDGNLRFRRQTTMLRRLSSIFRIMHSMS